MRYDRADASGNGAAETGGVTPDGPRAPEIGAEPAAIKLSPTSYLVLGMVRLGVSSGYAIKKMADLSTQNFWPTSLALIYPELARLEEGGLLSRRSDPQGGRARSAYTITDRGEVALTAWLRSERAATVQMRDEAMLKLFMADALGEPADQLELIKRLRERNRRKKDELRERIVPQAETFESHGIRYVAVAARLSADLLAYAEAWLERLEEDLESGGTIPTRPDTD
jgi:DNA-binding PadR family transcriptional regulator